jgi:carbon-monoxide dehydrogenase medium subunit
VRIVAPAVFDYARPASLAEALDWLAAHPDAAVLAGGTDVVTMRADGRIEPSALMDVKALPELRFVEHTAETVRIGAASTMGELAEEADRELRALIDGAAVVGSAQTRNRATIGGNICRSSPAGDALPGLLVLDALVVLERSGGSRRVPLREFFTGPGLNVRGGDELLTAIEVPRRGGGGAYSRLTYRAWMDLAVMGVAARIELDGDTCVGAEIAIGGMAPTPILATDAARALIGTGLGEAEIAAAVAAAEAICSPIDDVRGTSEYRLHGLRALLPRVVLHARARCEEPESA